MEQLNRIELKGRISAVRVFKTKKGTQVVRFSVCTTNVVGGPGQLDTTWHNCVLFTEGPEAPSLKTGSAVRVLGRLRMASYTDRTGNIRSIPEIVVNALDILNE